ncbi:unnamed protein product [Rotaria socialis]|uniref:Uncharacterized protein n=1 Tax=Rotaria socialis TaxID=392032 RepID=A0A820PUD7_9BILA|nr:unnamed protein product [Rotaria socialis]CAF3351000.1 unnamed protein product [Rotaria socialis]CAF3613890.1 unnamed protein product [Rotaria socialis]CAF3626297.1 unnamed protein product [Rotaria socialis]CAF4204076.1 unnamed protein product [Rotaria socialis]
MASNDGLELRIENIDQNKESTTSSTLLSLPIRQIAVRETGDPTLLKSRQHNASSSSNTNDTVTVVSIPMKKSRQFSVQNGGTIDIDTGNYLRFHRARRLAFWCCVVSFLLDIGLGLTAFVNCIRSKSFLGFSYSVDTLMDSLCTVFVGWHLMTPSINDIHRRDKLACCVIGALFIGSCLAIETRAIQSMLLAKSAQPDIVVFSYSLIHVTVFTVLSVVKIFISKQIKSAALMADAINSIIGLIMSFPHLFWDRVTFFNKFAHLDDLVQVLMALFLFLAGWKLILDSITTMNIEYARNLREGKLQRMLKEHNEAIDTYFEAIDVDNHSLSIAPIPGSRRFSVISNISRT